MTVEEIKARAIKAMQADLTDAYDALDYGDTELYKKYRNRYYAKAEMYEAMFEGEYVYHKDNEVCVETEVE